GKDAAQSSGWKALRSRQPEGKPSYLKVFPPGSPTILPAVNSSPAGNEEGHALWSRTESGALIIYTDEISFDISELFSVRYEQRLNGIAASTHLALLIGSTWYISDAPALQKQRGIWENVEYSLAGMTFGTAVHTPCLGPPLPENSGFHLPPIGQVLAFGVVVKDVNGRIRIDNFALNNRHPEGSPEKTPVGPGVKDCQTGGFPLGDYGLDADELVQLCREDETALDCLDDPDQDSLVEREEWYYGTNPLDPDTDGDGRRDGAEVDDGSSPLDSGSFLMPPAAKPCLEWNNFFGMWNVAEHLNAGTAGLPALIDVRSITGSPLEQYGFYLSALEQRDILVHETPQRLSIRDSYGVVCSSDVAARGTLRLAMIQYKTALPSPGSTRTFQYALGAPASIGVRGKQVIPFNTFSPSIAAGEENFRVANWITLVNQGESGPAGPAELGRLTFYNLDGAQLDSFWLALAPGERRDFAGGHQFGINRAGLVEFEPANPAARFSVSSSRYVYNNAAFDPAGIVTAFRLPAAPPTGRPLAVPLDAKDYSAILEVGNVNTSADAIEVTIFNDTGVQKQRYVLYLAPKSSYHIITDALLEYGRGTALIKGVAANSTIAVAMHYRRRSSGSIKNMFGLVAREALGTAQFTSYNTFLGQQTQLWGVNAAQTAKDLTVSYATGENTYSTNDTS
ncbi:MAG TPA: thrombospondin type 3 repeat-containing protein, partial [Oligoflexia bacterium]|nr:thrombospondin type 3 repeat-containing protein [Oligoflexia bacterium]